MQWFHGTPSLATINSSCWSHKWNLLLVYEQCSSFSYILSLLVPINILFGLFLNYVIYGFLSTIVMQTPNSPFCMQVVHSSHVGKWNSIVKLFLFWNLTWTCASTLVGVFQECCQTLWWSCRCLVTKTFWEVMLSYVAQNCEALLLKFHPKLWNFITKVSREVDQEKGFITFETFPKEFLLIGHNGMTINSSLTIHYLMFSYVL
jgi:hypothetical protein